MSTMVKSEISMIQSLKKFSIHGSYYFNFIRNILFVYSKNELFLFENLLKIIFIMNKNKIQCSQ